MIFEWAKPVATKLLVIGMCKPFAAKPAAIRVNGSNAHLESDVLTYMYLPDLRKLHELICGIRVVRANLRCTDKAQNKAETRVYT